MRYLSVCSGIEAATAAWHPLGWKPAAFSEIEAFPRAVLKHHYPDVPLHGDFTTIEADQYGPIDLLVGGTPCQSFSIAGLRGGLDDERGNLALEFLKLAQRTRPRWLVWENVPGVLSSNGGRDFGSILGGLVELGYGFAYRVLDAQFFGVAQRRRRVFVVGHLGDWRRAAAVLFERHSLSGHPAPRREKGKEVAGTLESRASGGGGGPGAGTDGAAAGYLQPVSWPAEVCSTLDADFAAKHGQNNQQVNAGCPMFVPAGGGLDYLSLAKCLTTGTGLRYDAETETLIPTHGGGFDVSTLDGLETARTLTRRYDGSPCHDRGPDVVAFEWQRGSSQNLEMTANFSPALIKSQTPAVAYGFKAGQGAKANGIGWQEECAPTLSAGESGTQRSPGLLRGSAVRRLTPVECERLQGFPDGFTQIPWRGKSADQCPDGPRYKALGNSMAVPVMAWIGKRIQMVEEIA